MSVIRNQDLESGRAALERWHGLALHQAAAGDAKAHVDLPRKDYAMAVRYSLYLLTLRAPGGAVEVRVAPWGAVKILDGPSSDPHNLTPPDTIELDPDVWLRVACGITSWSSERDSGHISAMGERDDLSRLLPLLSAEHPQA
ncbi:sterol carrier family protein [Bifidobacterium psychraerophilum]|jgi:hypothetical protein|uniref:Bacterial SCP orthologue domain-containing protein n=1 Tax=Bifidobacterium psychraerophilum TaxID=218140 RepID=A0A087CHT3_9BIFI|nr:sterol carrier family protein [Bifidobacterium psychraerophilum]KFI82833.1 hypothetical protein BPSY_0624 [Bifidobacterium psychraerophilum]MCI1804516.1 sterol carrier family protein [Bifidobacterium psychraerophilum]MCI2176328.1 sterol carrier family protein [Bifidobacterium psychraerophilum]MCI2181198.1 sterol carrier family protein [Bifidobacterium psychraerophilum]PKA94581.1 hypothetical protein A9A89_0804 [Bifidobacterium psychraerophilum DSM 22366]